MKGTMITGRGARERRREGKRKIKEKLREGGENIAFIVPTTCTHSKYVISVYCLGPPLKVFFRSGHS